MIQRQQTLWLLLSTIAALLCFMFPFATGKGLVNGLERDKELTAGSHIFLLVLTGATLVLSTVIIFLYKSRKQQMKLCLLGILLTAGLITVYVMQYNKLEKGTLALASVLPLIILIGYVMAYRNIRKDEKLVKSLDK